MADSPQQAEETTLVLLAQQGDGNAFRALVERYDRRLLYFIRRMLNESEDAFDVLQGVWLHVHRNLRRLQSPRAFRVWLYRIAHDQSISALRSNRQWVDLESLPEDELTNGEVPESAFDAADLVHSALRLLSVDQRRVLTLHFLEDMSIDDIARVLGCSPGTVKSRLHYARAALRRHIELEEREDG